MKCDAVMHPKHASVFEQVRVCANWFIKRAPRGIAGESSVSERDVVWVRVRAQAGGQGAPWDKVLTLSAV